MQVGSYSYDMARMVFNVSTLGYIQRNQSIVMDYDIIINNLKDEDKIFDAGPLGNYSLAGFEMVSLYVHLHKLLGRPHFKTWFQDFQWMVG